MTKNTESVINEINEIKQKHNPVVEKTTTTGEWGLLHHANNIKNDSPEAMAFFETACELYKLIYIRHIGSGIFYDYAYYTESMRSYTDEARPIIESYIENNLWDNICNSQN